jgi:formylglycine-generating enzyme required for sulfatase activity
MTATGTGTSDTDTSTVDIGADWTTIPGGSFWMGTPNGSCPADYAGPGGAACASELGRDTDEKLHYVTLTYAFEMMRTEVTQAQFHALLGYNPSKFGPSGEYGHCGDDCPVEQVNWHEALAYANALSAKEGLDACFTCTGALTTVTCSLKGSYSKPQDCAGYRLPTESEWEFAARAGTLTAFDNGGITTVGSTPLDSNLDEIAWYGGNSASATSTYKCSSWYPGATTCGTQAVAGKTANAWGLYDMRGEVWEWIWDWYQAVYPDGTTATPLSDPVGGASSEWRLVRGGSWMSDAKYARAGKRDKRYPDWRGANYGFRLVRSLP